MLPFLASRWFLTCVGSVLIAGLVWIFGPLLPQLEDALPRAAAIGVIVLLWGAINFLLDARRRGRDSALAAGVTAGTATSGSAAEEAKALRGKLGAALALLRKSRGRRGYLYEQPWYVIIGPPGAGKTTALLNAGLQFPLAGEMGQGAVAGVGGTRLCEWWFTNDAVLIDTAGRYTTQDSDAAIDKAGWSAFLDLLRRTRPRQPLNGVLVAIALSDIAEATPGERNAHARAIRARVKELEDRLGVRLPIYTLFTKADLIAGFSEFFDDLDKERRAQVWGATFPFGAAGGADKTARAKADAGAVARFASEFGLLLERLNARLYERLQAERSPDRRAMIASFPTQVAGLESPLTEFLREAFGGTRSEPGPMLRGVYLTSGTQEGTPIDRLTGVLSRSFGVDQRRAPSLRPERGRSYFLTNLLSKVVFGEAMLVSNRPGRDRQRTLLRSAGYALVLLVLLGGAGVLYQSDSANRKIVDGMNDAVMRYDTAAKASPLDPVKNADLAAVLPVLDQARAMSASADTQTGGGAWVGLGLEQDAKLGAAARTVYRHALERVMLPRLIAQLEGEMRDHLNQPEYLYEATRVYLMLGSQGPLDPDLVKAWMTLAWTQIYRDPSGDAQRQSLAKHLDALLTDPLPEVPLDGALVTAARTAFGRVPLGVRVYARIKPSAAAQKLPPWRPADVLAASNATVFVRASGKPLTDGIPGLFTVEGFRNVLLPALDKVAHDLAAESWVFGEKFEITPGSPQAQALAQDVVRLYERDYIQQWDAMLADLNLAPLRSIPQAAQDLYAIGGQPSPMRDLLTAIVHQVTLAGSAGVAGGPPNAQLGKAVDDRYKALRDFVGSGTGTPLDQALRPLNELQQQLAKLASAGSGGVVPAAATTTDPAAVLRSDAAHEPQPVARWMLAVATSGAALRTGGAKAQMSDAYNAANGPAATCRQTLATPRYPFVPSATADVPLDEFARLFAPGKALDGFFNQQLRAFVDMKTKPWKTLPMEGTPPPVSPQDLAQFQRAAQIRDMLFGASDQPTVKFDIKPLSTDAGAKQVTIDLDGTPMTYVNSGPQFSHSVTWPGPKGMQNIRVVFDPPPTGRPAEQTYTGPWALLRFFAAGKLQRQPTGDHDSFTLQLGDRQAVFDIAFASAQNPIDASLLQDFRCPAIQ